MENEFYTVQEFADLVKIQREQVYAWIKSGKVRAMRLENGPKSPWRIPITEILKLHSECYEERI